MKATIEDFKNNDNAFPLSYYYTEINYVQEGSEEDRERYFVESRHHQTQKYIPLGFYKLISLGIKMEITPEI